MLSMTIDMQVVQPYVFYPLRQTSWKGNNTGTSFFRKSFINLISISAISTVKPHALKYALLNV